MRIAILRDEIKNFIIKLNLFFKNARTDDILLKKCNVDFDDRKILLKLSVSIDFIISVQNDLLIIRRLLQPSAQGKLQKVATSMCENNNNNSHMSHSSLRGNAASSTIIHVCNGHSSN